MARGYAPVGIVVLLALTVLTAATVATALPALPGEPPSQRATAADATSDGRIAVTLLSGDPVDVRDATVRIAVDGERLRRQPPVPFFSARGFRSGPTGPFNVAADPQLTVGETASLRVADTTNRPSLGVGATLTVEVLVDGHVVSVAETSVEPA